MRDNKKYKPMLDCYRKLCDSHSKHVDFSNKMKVFVMDYLVFEDEEWEDLTHDNLRNNCSVFNQSSDGMVFELCSKNAPLRQIVLHIMEHGKLTLNDYLYYAI